MITLREAASGLLEAVVAAIEYGDWKVDGACDPTVDIVRLKNILAKPEHQWIGLTDDEMSELANKYKHIETGWRHDMELIAEVEAKLKEKNG